MRKTKHTSVRLDTCKKLLECNLYKAQDGYHDVIEKLLKFYEEYKRKQ